MLEIYLEADELFDHDKELFIDVPAVTLNLEHSLVSISKWESFTEKAFLGKDTKTEEDIRFYIKCMSLGEKITDEQILRLRPDHIEQINEYIQKKMTATWFADNKHPTRGNTTGEVVTSELIYYWMTSLQIPFECQHWNINRLITLIRVCNLKNQPAKKMNRREAMAQARAMNAQRREQMGSNG